MSKVIQSTTTRGIANATHMSAVGETSSSTDIDDVVPTRERLFYKIYVKFISTEFPLF